MIIPDLLDAEGKRGRFARISLAAMEECREDLRDGIGLLAEKWQHQIIKRYLTEDPAEHEVKLPGTRFVSDVRVENDIYEVQTGPFAPMKRKLERYLSDPALTVTVVHPLPAVRYLSWMDPGSGEIGAARRVGGKKNPLLLLPELYPLIPLLPYVCEGRLTFRLLLLEVRDFRLLDGRTSSRKAGATRLERIPTALVEDRSFRTPGDLAALLPPDLPDPMTVAEFAQRTGIRGIDSYSAVRVLLALGLFAEAPKKGRAMTVRRETPRCE